MSEEIIKILDELGKRLGIAIDWSNENIMPYLQDLMGRFIAYKNIQAVLWILISAIGIGLSIWGIKMLVKWRKSDKFNKGIFDDDEFFFGLGITVISLCILIFSIIMFCNLQAIAQNVFIPELSIIDYIKSQM